MDRDWGRRHGSFFVKKEMNLNKNDSGWAFGMGLTRMAMLKYNVTDIRKLHQSLLKV